MRTVQVKLKERGYPVYIGCVLDAVGRRFLDPRYGSRVFVLTDQTVERLYAQKVADAARRLGKRVFVSAVPPGETSKSLRRAEELIRCVSAIGMDRSDVILAVGGGVVSDLAGFVASIYLRGVGFAVVPTTLLAQVDAAVGGKTGVNLPRGKNLVGSFYQPDFVWIDVRTLRTLSERNLREGVAEIVKYGVVASRRLFERLERLDSGGIGPYLEPIVAECVRIKAEVIRRDERETQGGREVLNFGHTLGHAIEINYLRRYNHGEAVALGMIGESFLAWKTGLAPADLAERVAAVLRRFRLPCSFAGLDGERVAASLKYDKKVRKGRVRFVLPEGIGKVRRGVEIRPETVRRLWKEMCHAGENRH